MNQKLLNTLLMMLLILSPGMVLAWNSTSEPDSSITISNIFMNTDIRAALQDISADAEVPIIYDNMVSGYVSAEFEDLPLRQVLERLCKPFGYTFSWQNGYYLVGAPFVTNTIFSSIAKLEVIPLNYITARQAISRVSSFYQPFLFIDEDADVLTIQASPEIIEDFKKNIRQVDIPSRQIKIDAIIMELSRDWSHNTGVNWSVDNLAEGAGFRNMEHVFQDDDVRGLLMRYLRNTRYLDIDLGVEGMLQVLEDEGIADIRAQPSLVAQEGVNAHLDLGHEEYYSMLQGNSNYPQIHLEAVHTGITLNISSIISDSGSVTMKVETVISDIVGQTFEGYPKISRREVNTTVRVQDQEQFAIGGLTINNVTNKKSGIPFLVDIPFIGRLFGKVERHNRKSEVIILIKPKIIYN